MSLFSEASTVRNLSLGNNVGLLDYNGDPSLGLDAPINSLCFQRASKIIWHKYGANTTDWNKLDGITKSTSDPTVNADISSGFKVGSTWVNTSSEEAFLCIDNAASHAVWKNITSLSSGNSPLVAKGDLYTYDSDNARLPVGTDGQILTADSSESNGLKWINATGGSVNPIQIDTSSKTTLSGSYDWTNNTISTLPINHNIELTDVLLITYSPPPSIILWVNVEFTQNGSDDYILIPITGNTSTDIITDKEFEIAGSVLDGCIYKIGTTIVLNGSAISGYHLANIINVSGTPSGTLPTYPATDNTATEVKEPGTGGGPITIEQQANIINATDIDVSVSQSTSVTISNIDILPNHYITKGNFGIGKSNPEYPLDASDIRCDSIISSSYGTIINSSISASRDSLIFIGTDENKQIELSNTNKLHLTELDAGFDDLVDDAIYSNITIQQTIKIYNKDIGVVLFTADDGGGTILPYILAFNVDKNGLSRGSATNIHTSQLSDNISITALEYMIDGLDNTSTMDQHICFIERDTSNNINTGFYLINDDLTINVIKAYSISTNTLTSDIVRVTPVSTTSNDLKFIAVFSDTSIILINYDFTNDVEIVSSEFVLNNKIVTSSVVKGHVRISSSILNIISNDTANNVALTTLMYNTSTLNLIENNIEIVYSNNDSTILYADMFDTHLGGNAFSFRYVTQNERSAITISEGQFYGSISQIVEYSLIDHTNYSHHTNFTVCKRMSNDKLLLLNNTNNDQSSLIVNIKHKTVMYYELMGEWDYLSPSKALRTIALSDRFAYFNTYDAIHFHKIYPQPVIYVGSSGTSSIVCTRGLHVASSNKYIAGQEYFLTPTSNGMLGTTSYTMGTVQNTRFYLGIALSATELLFNPYVDAVVGTIPSIDATTITHNSANVDPSVTDDSNSNYTINSLWTNTSSNTNFICADSSVGAAVWNTISSITMSDAEIKIAYENNADTNAFTDADQTKLSGIEDGAEVNLTDTEVKVSYENNADTNAFTDAEKTKLSNLANGSDIHAIHVNAANEISGITSKTIPSLNDLLVIEDNADSNNKKSIDFTSILNSEIYQYDYYITTQNEFDVLFDGTLLSNVSIFLKKTINQTNINDSIIANRFSFELNNKLVLGNNVYINSDNAIVKVVTTGGVISTSSSISDTVSSVSNNTITVNDGSKFHVDDPIMTSNHNYYNVISISGNILTVDSIVDTLNAITRIDVMIKNITLTNWTLDGFGGVHGMHGNNIYNNVPISLSYCTRSLFDITFINFQTTEELIRPSSDLSCFNITINNIQHCIAEFIIRMVSKCNINNILYCESSNSIIINNSYGIIHNVNGCTSTNSIIISMDYGIIDKIHNCTSGGGTINFMRYSHITDIYNCVSTDNGGAVSNSSKCHISNIVKCSANNNGGAVYNCTYSSISNIHECSALLGGGLYNVTDSIIDNIHDCVAVTEGGASYDGNNNHFIGSFSSNITTNGTHNTIHNSATSTSFIPGNINISSVTINI